MLTTQTQTPIITLASPTMRNSRRFTAGAGIGGSNGINMLTTQTQTPIITVQLWPKIPHSASVAASILQYWSS